jgi:hypothetical protein
MNSPFDFDGMARLVDVFFNGRPAQPTPVTIRELIRRGVSHVKMDGKVYRIEVREMEPKKA